MFVYNLNDWLLNIHYNVFSLHNTYVFNVFNETPYRIITIKQLLTVYTYVTTLNVADETPEE